MGDSFFETTTMSYTISELVDIVMSENYQIQCSETDAKSFPFRVFVNSIDPQLAIKPGYWYSPMSFKTGLNISPYRSDVKKEINLLQLLAAYREIALREHQTEAMASVSEDPNKTISPVPDVKDVKSSDPKRMILPGEFVDYKFELMDDWKGTGRLEYECADGNYVISVVDAPFTPFSVKSVMARFIQRAKTVEFTVKQAIEALSEKHRVYPQLICIVDTPDDHIAGLFSDVKNDE